MAAWLYFAALLAFAIGVAHSYLGERYLLIRLFRRGNLPPILGSAAFTERTLRFAWHVTTIAWWGLAGIVILVAAGAVSHASLLYVIAGVFLLSAVIAAAGSRFRHYSWIVFGAIGIITALAAR